MKTAKTLWEWSVESEAKRLIHTAHNIATGFLQANNLFVVPVKLERLGNSEALGGLYKAVVTFPELAYMTIPRFWDRAKREDIWNFPLAFEPDLVNQVTQLLQRSNLCSLQRLDLVEKTWQKASKEILAEIYKIMPDKKGAVSQIIIHPTNFGTTCSFGVVDKFPAVIEMYLRQDQDIYTITEAILSAITRNEVYEEFEGMWSESELLVDWLLLKSSLSPILKKYQPRTNFIPTVKYTRMKQLTKLMRESSQFCRRLGAPVLQDVFGLKDGEPMIGNRLLADLSPREKEIMAMMINKSGHTVTIDEMADLLFQNDDEYSLAAIAKTVQRLRDKLELNGISGSFIQTLRGQGYILRGTSGQLR